ncbi:hypothetical protein WA026_004280 [Henosepilachna vigintioctopunctata]|uniref:Uncharacterized protein n=1 Tax=Henosepilachna vigintioctopunctata TaxID=420089 RepID=A0AAW1V7L8_9CUCU
MNHSTSDNMMSTSEYRGASNSDKSKKFSQVLKNSQFPKKDPAIILNHINELNKVDYVRAIADIVEAKNIIAISKISNNRICVYLSSSELVDKIIANDTIQIQGNEVGVRRLVTPAKRIILSNVNLCIPHDILETEIQKI